MLPVSFAAIIFTLGLSVFLNTSFHSLKDYNHQLKDFTNWQETGMAAAKRVSAESSNLLTDLKEELDSCLEEYAKLETKKDLENFQCQTKYQDIVLDYQKSLKENYSNQLNSTIQFGLNPDTKTKIYKSYSYKLYHSERLPAAFKKGDELYNSTLVKTKQLEKEVNLKDCEYSLDANKLKISAKLLQSLVGTKDAELIAQNPEKFKLKITDQDSFDEKNLPNAIKINIKFKRRQSLDFGKDDKEKKDETLSQDLMAAGQLRVLSSNNNSNPTIVVCNRCGCPGYPACPNPVTPIFNATQQQITFGQFDNVTGRGIYFDNSQPASIQNQVNIINTNQNRFTSVYPGAGNYLTVNIGTFPNSSSVLQSAVNNANRLINLQKVEFATVSFDINVPNGHKLNITGTNNLSVDIVPRARKRYMIAGKDFRVNGRTIAKGTILVGTLAPNSGIRNPQFRDLSSIRAYNPNTGALMQIFKPGDRNRNDCSGSGECMNINQFTSAGSNPNLQGSIISTSFSTNQLFPGKPFADANRLFVNIQRDLEVNSNMGIYNANFNWQKDILRDDLNAEQKILVTETLKAYNFNSTNDRRRLIKDLGIGFVRTGDDFTDKLQNEVEQHFVDFLKLKYKSFQNSSNNLSIDLRKSRNKFTSLRNVYQDFMKASLTKRKADDRVLGIIGRRLLFIPAPPKAPSHPGAAPRKPNKPICKKPKSNACKKKKRKYKNDLDKYQLALKKYNKKLAKYRNDLRKYQIALNEYNEKYG